MGQSVDSSGEWSTLLFYAVQLTTLLVVLLFVVPAMNPVGGIVLGGMVALLLVAMVVALWRKRTDRDGAHPGNPGDITYDPIADPGQAAKHSWRKAVRSLHQREDDKE